MQTIDSLERENWILRRDYRALTKNLEEQIDALRAQLAAAQEEARVLREALETVLGTVARSDLKGKVPRDVIAVATKALAALATGTAPQEGVRDDSGY